MPVSTTSSRIAPALLFSALIGGCSAEPAANDARADRQTADTKPAAPPPVIPAPAPAPAPAAPESAAAAAPRLAVEGEGLRWFLQPGGSARPIPFGRPQGEVIASLERVRGPATKGTNQECGAGPVEVASWPDGLSLIFQDGRFAGWGLGRKGASITTAAGIGPGSSRAELEAAYSTTVSQTSLGSEFSAGDLHGVLDGPTAGARITDMWAGVSCVAR